jgi:hypothetical protein
LISVSVSSNSILSEIVVVSIWLSLGDVSSLSELRDGISWLSSLGASVSKTVIKIVGRSLAVAGGSVAKRALSVTERSLSVAKRVLTVATISRSAIGRAGSAIARLSVRQLLSVAVTAIALLLTVAKLLSIARSAVRLLSFAVTTIALFTSVAGGERVETLEAAASTEALELSET